MGIGFVRLPYEHVPRSGCLCPWTGRIWTGETGRTLLMPQKLEAATSRHRSFHSPSTRPASQTWAAWIGLPRLYPKRVQWRDFRAPFWLPLTLASTCA